MQKKRTILLETPDAETRSDLAARLAATGYAVLDRSPGGTADLALRDVRCAPPGPSAGTARIPTVLLVPRSAGSLPSTACWTVGLLALPCADEALRAAVEDAWRAGEPTRLLRRGWEGIRSLSALSAEAAVFTDLQGGILLFSSAAEHLLGWAPDAVRGTPFLQMLDGGGRERYAKAAAAVLDGAPLDSLNLEVRRADGTLLPAVLTLCALPTEDGLCLCVLVRPSATDPFRVEVRKMAHDINNALAAILGYSELARDSLDDRSALEEYTGELLKASTKAQDLLAALMRLVRGNR